MATQARTTIAEREHPRICFKHFLYTDHAGLAPYFSDVDRLGGSASTKCLSQDASLAVWRNLSASYSLFLPVTPSNSASDRVQRRLAEVAGLHPDHGHTVQLLSYGPGSSYEVHTDCNTANKSKLYTVDKAATFLGYLSDNEHDGLVGGSTDFPFAEAGRISVKPKRGLGLFFYGYNGDMCDKRSSHIATAVEAGTKLVMQRWFSYMEDNFGPELGLPYPFEKGHLPYQPEVSCDRTGTSETDHSLSCRWYSEQPYRNPKYDPPNRRLGLEPVTSTPAPEPGKRKRRSKMVR
eukprot:gnl/TRDRNA2_/TRDRNA2_91909_c0_seq1.p1 gnl/TRDRNA2_/TRDRNA2_91909_c0~~gnl/TRDRNA2_/TRDRNA2_91909_c0_seq1.p1  ORF type:complete len:330 (-),score=36.32 gnl/TRDRNA2_/TRDRNA2_91909_c0_seq1:86-961(-)